MTETSDSSGNRWEPGDDASGNAPIPESRVAPGVGPQKGGRVRRLTARVRPLVAAAAAAALVLAGGFGFGLGRATAGHDGRSDDQQHVGGPGGGVDQDGHGDGFDRGGPHGPPPGQQEQGGRGDGGER